MEAHIFLLVLLCKAAFPQPDDDDYYANTPSDDDYEYDPLNPFIRTTTGKPVRESAKHRFRDRRPFATPCHQNEDRVCARNCSLRPECRMDCYINGDDPSYQVCTLKRGCVCGSGFVRDTNLDLCITRADCNRIRFEPRCPETEVYHRHEATECPRYCKISHKLGECQKTLPRSGCICPPPRIRDWTFGYMDCVTNETCVLRQRRHGDPSKTCPHGETYSENGDFECATDCRYRWGPVVCRKKTRCVCKEGFYRDTFTGMCLFMTACDQASHG